MPAPAVSWDTYGTWDTQARRNAADAAMRAVVDRFNAYGDFNWGNEGLVRVYYDASVPTAQASYYGRITFGGTWPNERVTQHEINHWFGTGTYWKWPEMFTNSVWNGPRVNELIRQFDGDNAVIRSAGYHFYPYGLNYDSEVKDAATFMRNVALTYAMRQDMGNGKAADPWSATTVTLTGSDPLGTSAFNWYGGGWSGAAYPGWSDKYVPHADAYYSTGNFLLRTPLNSNNPAATTPSFTFGGRLLTINNTNGIDGGLLFKGVGTTGVVTIPNLLLDGGYVRHASGSGDLFQLDGNLILRGSPTIDAAQGDVRILGSISGTGRLTTRGPFTVTLAGTQARYTGGTVVESGTLVLEGGGASGAIRGSLAIQPGATVRLAAVDALGWQAEADAVTEIDIAGTLDNAVAGRNGLLASWTLTGGTISTSGGGEFQIAAARGKTIASRASGRTSFIRADVVIGDADSVLPIIVEDGPAAADLWVTGAFRDSGAEAGRNGIRKEGSGTLVLSGSNTFTGPTTVRAGTLQLANSATLAASEVTIEAGATMLVGAGITLRVPTVQLAGGTLSAASVEIGRAGIGSLQILDGQLAGGSSLAIGGGGTVTLADDLRVSLASSGLVVDAAAGGILDLGGGQLSISREVFSPQELRADIISGRAGGTWTGTGITSGLAAASGGTRAVGYRIRSDGTAVISFAAPGDLDLNGVVEVFDLIALADSGTYGSGVAAVWADGDVNYDGVTNVFDLLAISTADAYGRGNYFPPAPVAATAATVPEPGCLLPVVPLLAAAAACRKIS